MNIENSQEEAEETVRPIIPDVCKAPYTLPPRPPINQVPPFVASPRDLPRRETL